MLPCPSSAVWGKTKPQGVIINIAIAHVSLPNSHQKQKTQSGETATDLHESIQKYQLSLVLLDFDFVQLSGKPSGIRAVNRNQ